MLTSSTVAVPNNVLKLSTRGGRRYQRLRDLVLPVLMFELLHNVTFYTVTFPHLRHLEIYITDTH